MKSKPGAVMGVLSGEKWHPRYPAVWYWVEHAIGFAFWLMVVGSATYWVIQFLKWAWRT